MKKVFILLVAFVCLTVVACKKEKGCTDSTATNYNADAEEDDGSCTYDTNTGGTDTTTTDGNSGGTTDTTATGGGTNGGGNTGGGTTDTTTVDTTTTGGGGGSTPGNAGDGELIEGSTTHQMDMVTVVKSGNYTVITVPKKDSISGGLSIQIDGDLPSTTTTYPIKNHILDASTASFGVTSGGVTWQTEWNGTGIGDMTIAVNGDGTYTISFTGVKLVDNAFAPTQNQTFSGSFTFKNYTSSYSLSTEGKTYTSALVGCTQSSTAITLTASSVNEDNKSGSLSIYFPVGVGSETLTVGGGSAIDWLAPTTGTGYMNVITYNSAGTTQISNVAQSGTIEVVRTGDELSVTFSQLPTSSGTTTDVVTGTATCLIK